ncbi:MAG: hypothetical protein ACE5E7_00535 [Anaerolineae bacterium]
MHWLGLALVIAIICQPLLGAPPKGDDILLHVYRIPFINNLWRQGVLYSRWLPDLVFGYGSPLLNFYPPLSIYALTLGYWLAGANAPAALNLVFALSLATAVTGMFYLGRALYGVTGGLVTAIAYGFSPYLLYQVYNRGSLSNALALAFFPLAALGLLRALTRPTPRRVVVAAIVIAAVMLSHTAASFLFMGPLVVWGVAGLGTGAGDWRLESRGWSVANLLSSPRILRPAAALGTAVAAGLALSAFSWLPALVEIGYTRYAAAVAPEKVDFAAYFAPLWPWPGTVVAGSVNAPLPPSTGLGQSLLGLAAAGMALAALWGWARRRGRPFPRRALLVSFSGLLGVAGLYMALSLSTPIWTHLLLLRNLQFPWRFLDIPAFFLPLACGYWAVANVTSPRRRTMLLRAAVLLFFMNGVPYLYPPRLHTLPQQSSLTDVTAIQQKHQIYGLTGWGEYSSSTVQEWPPGPPFAGADAGATLAAKLRRDDLPPGVVLEAAGDPWRADLQFNLPQAASITFESHYFPGWTARVNGRPVPITPDKQGRLRLTVPAGEHQVTVAWTRTPVRWLADGVTAVAILSLLAALFWRGRGPVGGETAVSPRAASTSSYLLQLIVLLAALAAAKFLVLDRINTPLVRHLDADGVPGLAQPAWQDFSGQLRLLGYEITPTNRLTLYWQAQQSLAQRYRVRLTLANGRGEPVKTIVNDAPGYSPTNTWEAGHLVRDVYELPLDEGERPFLYRLRVGVAEVETKASLLLHDSPDGRFNEVEVGRIKIPPPETAVLPANAAPVQAVFGQAIRLNQASFTGRLTPDQPLEVTFVWESLTPVQIDYTVFIHLLNPDGTLAAGNDGPPLGGLYPTSFWSPGEQLIDPHIWQPDLPPGSYTLQIGLYDPATGQRLPVNEGEAADRVILGTVKIAPAGN